MISVLCVRFGEAYSRMYVKKLRNMVARHLTVPYEFVCLTDDPVPIIGVKSIVQPNGGYDKGWWHKVHMFDPELPLNDTVLYFDLDTIIHENIDKLIDVDKHKICGIRDFNRKFNSNWNSLNSSVLCWQHKLHNYLWDDFVNNPRIISQFPGDQDWIWHKTKKNIYFWPDEWMQSYKWEIRERTELTGREENRTFKTINNHVTINDGCCVTVFHGYPKPDKIRDKFVIDNWR